MRYSHLLLVAPVIASIASCAFAPSGDPDGGRADARSRADASSAPSIDADPGVDAASSPAVDAAPSAIDAALVDAAPIVDTVLISEIVDATLAGGLPKFVEITNVGATSVDLSAYSVGVYSNANTTLNGGASHGLIGTLAAGASFVLSFENSDSSGSGSFFDLYGENPDDYSYGAVINGNDTVALFRGLATGTGSDAVTVDIYGQVGVDGAGEAWEYTDGFATRRQASTTPKAVFDLNDWGFSGPSALGGASAAAIIAATSPGTH